MNQDKFEKSMFELYVVKMTHTAFWRERVGDPSDLNDIGQVKFRRGAEVETPLLTQERR